MYGHLDNGLGLDGVFKHLSDLKDGDEVDIVTDDGRTLKFSVDATTTYPYQSVPPSLLGQGAADDNAHLSLITCTGHWVYDPAEGMTYDHRLVVSLTQILG
jgi:sortase (surface protein transpeptidase)